ncbi:glycosyltransferase [Siminovitchia acidinfaciens]|uniref:Glycosyltransferase n=1 Tax=Siminovitchia acidinfaciens TaxID=2321395 RepID=A0A429XW41_9BACI|nr:glycosyltransferase [Siminovitchia acidinfaciens]RST72556.1 glycosyltransferase [Siminovitchia acidinfaciens]
MRKKVLFTIINMNVGGTEKSLLNMVSVMPKDKYDITILMLEEYGGFLKFIPSNIRLEFLSGYNNIKDLLNEPPQSIALNLLKKGRIIKGGTILLLHIITKILNNRSAFFKYVLRTYPTLEQEYDVAVAYAGPTDFISYLVMNKIKAKKKIQWVHFDVTKIGFNKNFAAQIYNKFDKVFVGSNEGRDKLVNLLPAIREKTEVFQYIVSPQLISSQAKEGKGFNDNFDGLKILTVGRLSIEKGQDLAIHVLAKLKNEGLNVKWYCVGEGNSRQTYEDLIEKYELKEYFILLGSDPNPYPYMDQCDIYVQPSRHEGYCITLAEARCFKKPIITTNFTGANEQIKTGKTGLIVGPDVDEIYHALRLLIHDRKLREKFSDNLTKEEFISDVQVEKFI